MAQNIHVARRQVGVSNVLGAPSESRWQLREIGKCVPVQLWMPPQIVCSRGTAEAISPDGSVLRTTDCFPVSLSRRGKTGSLRPPGSPHPPRAGNPCFHRSLRRT